MAQKHILMTLSEIKFVSRTRNAATRCILRAYNAAKCDCIRGSAPDPTGGAYRPLAGFKGAASRRGGRGGRERRGRERRVRERE